MALTTLSPVSEEISENNSSDSIEEIESNDWPDWAKKTQCVSHLLLTFYSSVTFLIYYVKQKTTGNRCKSKNCATQSKLLILLIYLIIILCVYINIFFSDFYILFFLHISARRETDEYELGTMRCETVVEDAQHV